MDKETLLHIANRRGKTCSDLMLQAYLDFEVYLEKYANKITREIYDVKDAQEMRKIVNVILYDMVNGKKLDD